MGDVFFGEPLGEPCGLFETIRREAGVEGAGGGVAPGVVDKVDAVAVAGYPKRAGRCGRVYFGSLHTGYCSF